MHEMKLQEKYYDYILNGTKIIEIRLNDEKRSLIKIGDIITFYKMPELKESFIAKVIDLIKYNSFDDLFNEYDIDILADKSMTKKELKDELEKFYTKDKQNKYGVLAIKIKL